MSGQRGRVTIRTRDLREVAVPVEIASDDETRTLGLMFRKSMPETAGMIFVFPRPARQSFWMRNTFIPLDMIFADASGLIVGIVENAEPRTLTPRAVEAESIYVLEVNGGWCARHRVEAGDRLRLEGDFHVR